MTDEERAEDYYEDNECYSYLAEIEDFEEVFGFVKDRVIHAHLAGLAKGRELGKEELKLNPVRYVVCDLSEPNNPISICRKRITELEEELAELKAHCKAVDEVNVKLKCCGNCINRGLNKDDISYPCCDCKHWRINKSNDYWELSE